MKKLFLLGVCLIFSFHTDLMCSRKRRRSRSKKNKKIVPKNKNPYSVLYSGHDVLERMYNLKSREPKLGPREIKLIEAHLKEYEEPLNKRLQGQKLLVRIRWMGYKESVIDAVDVAHSSIALCAYFLLEDANLKREEQRKQFEKNGWPSLMVQKGQQLVKLINEKTVKFLDDKRFFELNQLNTSFVLGSARTIAAFVKKMEKNKKIESEPEPWISVPAVEWFKNKRKKKKN